jgi:hypothetical protein
MSFFESTVQVTAYLVYIALLPIILPLAIVHWIYDKRRPAPKRPPLTGEPMTVGELLSILNVQEPHYIVHYDSNGYWMPLEGVHVIVETDGTGDVHLS